MLNHLRAIYIFVKAVELGSFRATAKALSLSPSVVSYQISRLEKDLEVALLYRSTRRLSLTSEGRELYELMAALVAGAERGVDQLTAALSEPVGRLQVTLAASFSRENITRQIAAFARQHPRVEMSVRFSDEQKDLIADGIDLAIRSGPIADSSLQARKLFSLERILVASPRYLARMPRAEQPDDLADWDWIWLDVTAEHREFRHRQSGERQNVKLNKRVIVNDGYAMCEFAVEGLGVLTSPDYLVEEYLRQGQLVEVLPDWRLAPIDVYAIWPPNSPRTGLTRRFVDHLLEHR
ncbi:MAG TPA: LysR family transcriptional regulator [Gammaproteobacteria bacterium]|jgi:DNA-binding transcriptional LysR family regulator